MSKLIEQLELQELIDKLVKNGYEEIVKALLDNDKIYKKKGRLNKSGACRKLKLKPKELENKLNDMKVLLEKDME